MLSEYESSHQPEAFEIETPSFEQPKQLTPKELLEKYIYEDPARSEKERARIGPNGYYVWSLVSYYYGELDQSASPTEKKRAISERL